MRRLAGQFQIQSAAAGIVIAAGFSAFLAMPAIAAEDEMKSYPRIEGSLVVEVENDNTFNSDDPSAEINDLFATIELATGIYASRNFSLQSVITFEPVLDPRPFTDRTFGDQGAYFGELFLQFENDRLRVYGGKINAPFGTAWDVTPGIFGTAFAEDYQLAERIGGGVAVTFGTMVAATNTVAVTGFFMDTTALSESVFTNRGRTNLAAGGASNTESIKSFSLVLDSEEFADAPGLTTHIGLVHQAAGLGDVGDENGFALGFTHEHEFENEMVLTTNMEVAHLRHAGGGPTDNTFVTLGGQLNFGAGWNIAAAGTVRNIEQMGVPSITDTNAQISAGYEFQEGFMAGTAIDVGFGFVNDGGVHSTVFGIVIAREFEFELAAN